MGYREPPDRQEHGPTRRALLAAPLALGVAGADAWAQAGSDFPRRSIRLVSPYPPGGGTDTTGRLISGPLQRLLGQPVVVDNKAGASGSIGAAEVARAEPDGYTLLVDSLGHASNPALMSNLPFDYTRAFAPISQLTRLPQIMVAPTSLPPTSVPEFIAYAKANPGRLAYGSSGNASGAHLASVLFLREAGLPDIEHVPYRGGSAALQGVLSGDVVFAYSTVNTAAQLVQDGRLRAYAVASSHRLDALPDVPTLRELGLDVVLDEWNGFFAPAGTPPGVIARLQAAAAEALKDPAASERFRQLGAEPLGTSPEAFALFVVEQRAMLARLIRDANIRLG